MAKQRSGMANKHMLNVYGVNLDKVRWWFVEALMANEDFQLDY